MITLHRLGHAAEPFHLNPDLIITVEANPDTVISLTNGTKVVVAEPPERVVSEILDCRAEILAEALRRERAEHSPGSGVAARRAALSILTTVSRQPQAG
jgi:flagellar protein FlbD